MDFLPSRLLLLALAVIAEAAAFAGNARAEERLCTAPHLHLDLPSGSAWLSRIDVLRAELRDARVDRCAEVEIRAAGEVVEVNVTSGGRTASRTLTEPSELVRTVEALVVLPPVFADPAQSSPSEQIPEDERPLATPEPTHVELEVGASVRGGGNFYLGGGVAAMADVVVANYVLGVSGRWSIADSYLAEPTASGFSMESGALGVVLGRRTPLKSAFVDLLAGAQIVVENQEQSGVRQGFDGETLDTRASVAARVSTSKSSGFRPFVQADVEASPGRLLRSRRIDSTLPVLPAWTCGVALGVMWGPR